MLIVLFLLFFHAANVVDLRKIRLNHNAVGGAMGRGAMGNALLSPDCDEIAHLRGNMMRGFCCAGFPITKTITKGFKRL